MNIEQIKEILAGAPRNDWTHYCKRNRQYFKRDGNTDRLFVWLSGTSVWSASVESRNRWLDRRANLETILAQHEEIERLHSLIIGLINCGDSLISTKGKPHFEDYAYADWKDAHTKANATLVSSLTREKSK